MAFKDLENYYYKTKNNYLSALRLVEQFDKEHNEGIIQDKVFKRFKRNLDKLKDTYDMVCCFFTLWMKPTEEERLLDEETKDFSYLLKRNPDKLLKDQEKLLNDIKNYLETNKGSK